LFLLFWMSLFISSQFTESLWFTIRSSQNVSFHHLLLISYGISLLLFIWLLLFCLLNHLTKSTTFIILLLIWLLWINCLLFLLPRFLHLRLLLLLSSLLLLLLLLLICWWTIPCLCYDGYCLDSFWQLFSYQLLCLFMINTVSTFNIIPDFGSQFFSYPSIILIGLYFLIRIFLTDVFTHLLVLRYCLSMDLHFFVSLLTVFLL